MGESYVQKLVAYRLQKIKREQLSLKEPNNEIRTIDLSSDEPDGMADIFVVETLSKEASRWENRVRAQNGILDYKKAAKDYLIDSFQVATIDEETEIVHTFGVKSALASIVLSFITNGDVVIMPTPCVSTIGEVVKLAGGSVYKLPLTKENGFLPDFSDIPAKTLKKAKLLYLNYPNNPTGGVATREFFEEAIDFAKKNDILIVHDASYAPLVNTEKPLSLLSVKGAKKVAIECFSMSYAFNMTGWALGFVAGNKQAIAAISKLSGIMNSGQFRAIQHAGKYALSATDITKATVEKYTRRAQYVTDILKVLGFQAENPKAPFCLYIKIPQAVEGKTKFKSAKHFAEYLYLNYGIKVVPFQDSGDYICMYMTFAAYGAEEEKQVAYEIYERLKAVAFEF